VPKGAEVSFTDWLHLPAQQAHHVQTSFDTGFLFIPDLTAKATGAVLITLIVLYVGTQLASSLLMSITTDKTQRLIFMALPFFFVIFIINFPAGLLVYWITTNLWTVGQGLVVRRLAPPVVAPAGASLPTGARAATPDRKRRPQDRDENGGSREKAAAVEKAAPEKAAPRAAAPPPPPRKKKKRSGRRR
jgi:YidC/Oxa1 family membrane protein insertase